MGWLERLNKIKKDSAKTTDEISELSGIPKGTLNKLFAGQTKDPQLSTIRAVVHCMGYTLDDLDDSIPVKQSEQEHENFTEAENQIIKKYRLLDLRGQQAVEDTLDRELTYILKNKNLTEISEIAMDAVHTIDSITEGLPINQPNHISKK